MLIPTRYALALTLTAVVLVGCAPAAERPAIPVPPTPTSTGVLRDATAECGLEGGDGVQLNPTGTSLTIDTKGPRETSGADLAGVKCVLNALDVPENIQSMVKLSTSPAEPWEASWGGFGFAWNYSPETHLRIAIQKN